jgi:hypothetical protein
VDGGFDLAAVAHDARIVDQSFYVGLSIACHCSYIKVVEGLLKVGPLVPDDPPTEAGLKDRPGEFLKIAVIVLWFPAFRNLVRHGSLSNLRMWALVYHNFGSVSRGGV